MQFLDRAADNLFAGFLAAFHTHQTLRAERGADALANDAIRDFSEFHGGAANIADQPVRPWPAKQNTLC